MLDIDNEGKLFLNYGEDPPPKMAENPDLPEPPNPILQLGFKVPGQPSIEETNDWALAHRDKQAFDKLYDDIQEIHTISHRAIRGGTTRYKEALRKIMEICQGME